jgi:hypothetical protein
MRVVVRRLAVFLLVLCLSATVRADPVAFVTTGQVSPLGLPFSTFPQIAASDDGTLVYLGESTGTFTVRDAGADAPIGDVVAAGDVLPSGRTVAGVSPPVLGPGGCAVVRTFLVDGGSALVRRCGTSPLQALLATGDVVAGASGGTVVELSGTPATAAGGWSACVATLADGRDAVVRTGGGGPIAVVATGDVGPRGGTITGVRLVGVTSGGRVGFRAVVAGARDGYLIGDGTTLLPVVEVGEASPVGGTFESLSGASMNDDGTWAFRASVAPRGAAARAGVFRTASPDVGSAPAPPPGARAGPATDQPGVTFRSFPSSLVPSINGGGAIAFRATLSGADSGSGIFVAAPGGTPQVQVSAGTRTTVGGDANVLLLRLRDPAIADDGSVAFPASIGNQGPGLFVVRTGTVQRLVLLGQKTAVDNGDERFRFSTPAVRERAEAAVFLGSREGIFRQRGTDAPSTLAFVGGPTPIGGVYADLNSPAAGRGGVVFSADVSGGRASRVLVRVTPDGSARALAIGGDNALGKARFVDFFAGTVDGLDQPDVGPRGEIAFEASLEHGKSSRALFVRRGRRLAMIAGSGRRAPGGGTYQAFGTPALLRGGQVAFVAQVDGNGGKGDALFVRRGGTRKLAATGAVLNARISGTIDSIDTPGAGTTLLAWRVVLRESAREALLVQDRRRDVGMLLATGDAAPEGAQFKSFGRPVVSDAGVAFLGRLLGRTDAPALYRVAVTQAPAKDAAAATADLLVKPGAASPLGGTYGSLTAVDGDRSGALVVAADLVGAHAHSAIFGVSVP